MLVLSRRRGEAIVIGDDRTAFVSLSPEDVQSLTHSSDPTIRKFTQRLLKSAGPITVTVVDVVLRRRGRPKVKLWTKAHDSLPVHRLEIHEEMMNERRHCLERPGAIAGT